MSSVAQEAACELVLLHLGVKSTADVIAWADRVIAREDKPDSLLIELSTTPPEQFNEVYEALSRLENGCAYWAAVREALSNVHDFVEQHPEIAERVAKGLCPIVMKRGPKVPDDFIFMLSCDDAFDLARAGIFGDEKSATAHLLSDLVRFKK
jgi:hypothetical protein